MKLSFPARRSSDLLVRSSGIESVRIPIADHTRVSHTGHERSSGLEFRFVPEGPAVAPGEWRACLTALEAVNCDYLLASGSLPRGVPADFYVDVAKLAARKGAKIVLDTSGEGLKGATDNGVSFLKQRLGNMGALVWGKPAGHSEQESKI